MINTQKIIDRMKELEITQTEVAALMGIAQSTFSQKIRNERPMFLDEAEKLQEILKIPDDQFREYFFYHKVA